MRVVIDGVPYVPAREAHVDLREVVARTLADRFWGDLGEDWETVWRQYVADCRVVVTDDMMVGYTCHDFLEEVSYRLSQMG